MKTGFVELSSFDLLRIQGPDTARFLQGQLTCNVDKVTETFCIPGAYCNLKGRVISDFRLFMQQGDYYLQTCLGAGELLKRTLDKYIVFSKATSESATSRFRRIGVLGSDAETVLKRIFPVVPETAGGCAHTGAVTILRLEENSPRYEIYETISSSTALSALQSQLEPVDGSLWELADISAGVAHISNPMQEIYTPQSLNYDLRGLIDFRKGCYTGQEIVARMHYRGTAKKRLYHVCGKIAPDETVASLATVQDDALHQAEIIQSCAADGMLHMLAILSPEAVSANAALLLSLQPAEPGHSPHSVPAQIIPLPCFAAQPA